MAKTKLKFSRGLEKELPIKYSDGEIRFCTDTGALFIDNATGRTKIAAGKADKVIDSNNGREITINYSADALSNPTWLAGWNGYELRGVNRNDLSVNYATSAGSATKATQDGDGNTITSTYLKLSGGRLTDNLKVPSVEQTGYVASITAAGWYRCFTFQNTNASGLTNTILNISRGYNYNNNESYIFAITMNYGGNINITQLAGRANSRLITKIRIDYTNSGKAYIDFYVNQITSGDPYYVTSIGYGTCQAPTAISTATGTTYEFTTTDGVKTDQGLNATGLCCADGSMSIATYANNEVNFGGTNNSSTIYFGYRASGSKPIPTKFIFGNTTGTADLQAKTVYLGSGTASYISSSSYTGNAATATKLFTARTISLTGDVTGSTTFDGSGNVSITVTVVDNSHNHEMNNITNASTKYINAGTVTRKTIVNEAKNSQGYISRVALGLSNPANAFSPALLSVGTNDAGTGWTDFTFGIDGSISSPKGSFVVSSGNIDTSSKPLGFSTRQTSISWGTLANSSYTCITRWDTANSGSVAFADKDGQISMQIDGNFYQNEGNYKVLDTSTGLQLTGGTMSGQIAFPNNSSYYPLSFSAGNGGAFIDTYGNFRAASILAQTWNLMDSGGTPRFSVKWATGDTTIEGALSTKGRLTASGKISVPSSGSAWVSGMALNNASIAINTQNTDAAYHPLIAGKLYGGGVWNLGTITNKFGFYGFVSGHGSGNYTDYYMNIDGTTGKVEIKTYNSNVPLMLTSPSNETCLIDFYGMIGHLGSIGFASANGPLVRWNSGGSATYTILDSGNYSSYALPLSGGTMTGPLNTANGTYNKIGDDVSIGDINMAGTLGIIGQNGNTAIQLVNYGASTTTGTSATGVKWTCTGNGTSTISGTTSGTFSGTLDGYSSSRFLRNLGGSNYITINVGGNANTYYPVVLDLVSDKFPMQFINISRAYYETAPSSWNNETHKGGLTLTLLWNGSRYWDGNGGGSSMYCVHKTETYTTMVAGLGNSTAGAVVWLRGGGAVYHIHSMNGTSATARVYLEGFTDSSSKTFSPTTTISNIAIRWPGWSSGADSASNADKLDGFHGSASSAANTYILRDSSNYIWTNYIHSDTVNNENPAIGQVIVTNGSDGFYRKASLSHLKSSLGNMPASYAVCHDVRGVDRAPTYYTDRAVTAWFNETGTPWNGNWFSGLTVKGWSDGYCSWQLSSYSSTGTTDDCLYYRMGTPGGAWQSWRQIPTIKTITGSGAIGTITVANNTEYRYTGVTSLGINYPSGNFECWLRITVGSSAISLSFASGTSFIGTGITSLTANTSYEISIKDKVAIIKKVG